MKKEKTMYLSPASFSAEFLFLKDVQGNPLFDYSPLNHLFDVGDLDFSYKLEMAKKKCDRKLFQRAFIQKLSEIVDNYAPNEKEIALCIYGESYTPRQLRSKKVKQLTSFHKEEFVNFFFDYAIDKVIAPILNDHFDDLYLEEKQPSMEDLNMLKCNLHMALVESYYPIIFETIQNWDSSYIK